MFKGKPKIYFGDGGFRGMSEIRRSGSVNSRPSIRKSPSVYMGGEMSVGVSTRTVLASGGIARGGVVRVKATEKPKPVVVAISSPKVEKKSDECMPPMDERGNGCNEKMTEKEERLADFLEAAQDAKAKCEETDAPPEPPASLVEEMIRDADPPPTVESTSAAVLPELPIGEVKQPKKKRRRRKGRNAKAEGAGELKLTEVAI